MNQNPMRIVALCLAAAVLGLLAGCSTPPEDDGKTPDDEKNTVPSDVPRDKKRVMELLMIFEQRFDEKRMNDAAAELREIGKPLVDATMLDLLDAFDKPSTREKALTEIRKRSRRGRILYLLDTNDKENWKKCYVAMTTTRQPEDIAYLVAGLIIKFPTHASWSRPMLMDLCTEFGGVAIESLAAALMHEVKDEHMQGPFRVTIIDDNTREGLVTVFLHLAQPPVQAIEDLAKKGPISTRKAVVKYLHLARDGKGEMLGWAIQLLQDRLLHDPDFGVRSNAADALVKTRDAAAAVPILILALKDEDPFVRKTVCQSLGLYGGLAMDALRPVVTMLRQDVELTPDGEKWKTKGNPGRELRETAFVSLRLISGKRFENNQDLALWEAYLDELERKK